MAIIDVGVIPLGTETPSVSKYVAEAIKALKDEKDVKYELTAMGTIIEGQLPRLLSLAHEMGSLRAIIGSAGNHGPYRADVSVLWDWGPHDIAMNLALTGSSPSEVSVRRLQSSLVDGVVAENIEIAMTFPDDIHSRITIGTMMEKQRIFTAFLEKGTLVYDDLAQAKLVLHPPGATGRVPKIGGQIIDYENHPPLNEVIREFSEVAVGRQAVDHSLDIGVSVVSILTQADKHLVSI